MSRVDRRSRSLVDRTVAWRGVCYAGAALIELAGEKGRLSIAGTYAEDVEQRYLFPRQCSGALCRGHGRLIERGGRRRSARALLVPDAF